MGKKYNVVVNAQADRSMYAHISFLAQVSIPAANKLKKTLRTKLRSLEKNPYTYPVFESGMTLRQYRKIIIGRYVILCEISEAEKTVYVKYIWDSRMDSPL